MAGQPMPGPIAASAVAGEFLFDGLLAWQLPEPIANSFTPDLFGRKEMQYARFLR